MLTIERRDGACGDACREILRELPEWFGMPESNEAYVRDADAMPAWLAQEGGRAQGVLLLKAHEDAVEIWLIAVRRARRGGGLGSALLHEAERYARERGARFLTVKTRGASAPEPSPEYDETRAFYRARGFAALEEFATLWDADNPALFMAKAV